MTIYPLRASMLHDEAIVTVGNALLNAHDSAQDHAKYVRQNVPANGDTFTQSFLLKAGTYTFVAVGYESINGGKVDWYIDDVLVVSGQDWYGDPGGYNKIKSVGSITVTGNGRHVLKGVVNGKHASSGGYGINLTKYWLSPSTDTTEIE